MVVRFDALDRFEAPKFTLCNPGSKCNSDGTLTNTVGILVDTSAEEFVANFNSLSEFNLRVTRTRRDDPTYNEYVYSLYKNIQNRRMIFVDGIGYFVISNINDGFDEEGIHYKDIQAKSCEIELQNKMLPFIENGTYKFDVIMEKIIETVPLWTIGNIDDEVLKKHRTFEDIAVDTNILSFMLENMQDAYECIFIFDNINRVVNVYDQNSYVRRTDVHITKSDLINSLDITENSDELYTALSVVGGEDLTINAINPLGTSVIYNFGYYKPWMTDGLRNAVDSWEERLNDVKEDYYNKNVAYYDKLQQQFDIEAEIERLGILFTMYKRCWENIVTESGIDLVDDYNKIIEENGGETISISGKIEYTRQQIKRLMDTCLGNQENENTTLNEVKESITEAENEIKNISNELSFENFFTPEQFEELCNYIYEGNYTDDYVIVTESMEPSERLNQMKVLYDRATAQMDRVSKPKQEFNIDVENFIFSKEFAESSSQLETGCLINVEIDVDDVAMLFLSNMTVNYDDKTLSMTFGNRFSKFDTKSLFEDVLGNISKSANTVNYLKEVLYPIRSGEFNYMKEALQTSRDLTMNDALTSTDEEVVIDGSGYTGRRKSDSADNVDGYDPRQIKITGKSIVFTKNGWENCDTAIGEIVLPDGSIVYGVNAKAILGDIIMGGELHIVDEDGTPLFDVIDGKISANAESVKFTIKEEINNSERFEPSIGYVFDGNGLSMFREGDEINNKLNNKGMYVIRVGSDGANESVLEATAAGVSAVDLHARNYLIIGDNSRLENYSTESDAHRTGCFYIGG